MRSMWGRCAGLALAAVMAVGVVGADNSAVAADAQLFPVHSSLVPVVVAAVFVLPALMAASMSVMRRAARSAGPVLGIGLLVVAAAAVVVLVRPELLASIRV